MKKIETELAIVAAGPAGLCASVAAAEAGVEVVVFEKANVPGGTANMGMGPFGVESRVQERAMNNLTKEEVFRRFMDYVHWQADANLIHDYIWKSGDTINWLEDMGVRFAGAEKNFPDSEATWHIVQPDDGSRPGARAASSMNRALFQRAEELGVQFYFRTPVYKLLADGLEIKGLLARSEDGEEYEVSAKAVIVATGGFGTSHEMVRQYTGYELEKNMFDFMVPGIVGDGIRMAWEIGAGRGRMEMERLAGCPVPGGTLGEYPAIFAFNNYGNIMINKSGYRVCDESVMQNGSVMGNIVDYQQDHTAFRIMSSGQMEYYKRTRVARDVNVFVMDPFDNFDVEYGKMCEKFPDLCFMADGVEALAEKLGVPADTLQKTIDRYNEQCAQHYDDDFCKARKYLIPITGNKFYACKYLPGAYGSLGGIKINHRTEVLTPDYKVIKGFYAAGTDACDIYNGTYYFYLPGNTMGFAVNTGRMAGEYAADYILSMDEEE